MVAAPLVSLIFNGVKGSPISEMLWTFSIVLEAFAVLPQLLLLRQTTVPTVIDSYYLATLGAYRGMYLLNWIYRGIFTHKKPDPISVIFGIIQTAFYVDFAWVYFTRQRVKLRAGGVVDSEDLRKGWLVNRVIDTGRSSHEEDPEAQPNDHAPEEPRPSKPANKWGIRGVSISADDTLHDHHKGKAKATDSSESTGMLDNDDAFLSDEDDDAPALDGPGSQVLNSNQQWRQGSDGDP